MKHSVWVFALLCGALCVAQAPARYSLQYSADFQGDRVDTNAWTFRTDAKILSTQLPRNVSVHDGKLFITPRKEDAGGMHYTGGGVVSTAAFRYGYFQVDAQTTNDPGWHTSFWLMAGDGKTTFPMIARSEIDDFEIENPKTISMGYLVWKNQQNMGSQRCNNNYVPGYSTAEGMHTYAVEWTEEGLTYYLDGKSICTQPYKPTDGMHDRVNIWLTTIGAKKDIAASGKSPAIFEHVRYFVRDYYIGAGEPGYAEYGKDWHRGPEPGFSGSDSHASCSADAEAVYTPSILESGEYDVEVWRVKGNPSIRDIQFDATVRSSSGTVKKPSIAANTPGWVDLGVYHFARGVDGAVTLTSTGGGCVVANMVKFVRR